MPPRATAHDGTPTGAADRMPPAIRPALVEDAAGIARLSEELGYPASEADMKLRLAALLALASHYVVAAAFDDRLAGWAAVEIRTLLVAGRKAELMGLVVSAGARRLGVGRALIQATEHWVVGQGLDRMSVRSNVARRESHPFYERLGYTRAKTQHVYAKRLGSG